MDISSFCCKRNDKNSAVNYITHPQPTQHTLLWDWVISVCCAHVFLHVHIFVCVCVCVCRICSHAFIWKPLGQTSEALQCKYNYTESKWERESEREKSSSCLLMNLANAANVVYQVHIYLFIMAEVKNTTSCPHCSHDSPQGVRKDELVEQKAKEQRGREDKSETENKQTGKHGKQWERRQMKWKDCT